VDSARPFGCPEPLLNELLSRLNAVAVLAFCAEITRLPGHWAAAFTPENATAQTRPSRFTIVAHIWLFSPLVSAATAAISADFNCEWLGSPLQDDPVPPPSPDVGLAARATARPTAEMDQCDFIHGLLPKETGKVSKTGGEQQDFCGAGTAPRLKKTANACKNGYRAALFLLAATNRSRSRADLARTGEGRRAGTRAPRRSPRASRTINRPCAPHRTAGGGRLLNPG
jgi:hypothetical protein